MLFVGKSGCGKSTCVSHWLKQFTSRHPQVVIIPHFVGCDSGSSDISNFMRRCTSELRHHYLDSDIRDVIDIHDLSDFTRVTEAFRAAISLGKTGRRNTALIHSFTPVLSLLDCSECVLHSFIDCHSDHLAQEWTPLRITQSLKIVFYAIILCYISIIIVN